MLERMENGEFLRPLKRVEGPDVAASSNAPLAEQLSAAMEAVRRKSAARSRPARPPNCSRAEPATPGPTQNELAAPPLPPEQRPQEARTARSPSFRPGANDDQAAIGPPGRPSNNSGSAQLRRNVAVFRTAAGRDAPIALVDIVRFYRPNAMGFAAKCGHYLAKIGELLWANPRESNTEGGLFPAIFGTVMLVFLMAVTCFPLGVLAGIYLGEYAKEGCWCGWCASP